MTGMFKPSAYITNEDGTVWKNLHGHPVLKPGGVEEGPEQGVVRSRMWNYMVSLGRRVYLIILSGGP